MSSANRGYVSPENMGGDQKTFGNMKAPSPKDLPKGEGQKQFKHPGAGDKAVTDRDHGGVKANYKKN